MVRLEVPGDTLAAHVVYAFSRGRVSVTGPPPRPARSTCELESAQPTCLVEMSVSGADSSINSRGSQSTMRYLAHNRGGNFGAPAMDGPGYINVLAV